MPTVQRSTATPPEPHARSDARTAGLRVALAGLGCLAGYVAALRLVGAPLPLRVAGLLAWWALFVAVTRWVTRPGSRVRRPVLAVVLSAAVLQLPGVLVDPVTSTDAYRYVWDGRVQLSGTSPYLFVPLDDRLAQLRDPVLFPGLSPGESSGVATQVLPTDRDALLQRAADDPRTRINRPQVPTIYPPVAEGWFAAVAFLTPWPAGTRGLQAGAALVAVLIAGALAGWLSRRGGRPLLALWWAWCPVVLLESGNGAHADVVATGFILLAVLVATSRPGRIWAGAAAGLLLGLAASVKLTPLVVVPAVASWRGGWRTALPAPVAAVATLAATYLPHALVAGWLVVGYLPGYLIEESGVNRAAILAVAVPQPWRQAAVVAVVALAALWAVTRARGSPAAVAVTLYGVLLLAATPTYPWYALPLVGLAVLAGRLEWLAVAAAAQFAWATVLFPPLPGVAYAVAGLAVMWAARRRGAHGREARARHTGRRWWSPGGRGGSRGSRPQAAAAAPCSAARDPSAGSSVRRPP
jgi:hypothetical protein